MRSEGEERETGIRGGKDREGREGMGGGARGGGGKENSKRKGGGRVFI